MVGTPRCVGPSRIPLQLFSPRFNGQYAGVGGGWIDPSVQHATSTWAMGMNSQPASGKWLQRACTQLILVSRRLDGQPSPSSAFYSAGLSSLATPIAQLP